MVKYVLVLVFTTIVFALIVEGQERVPRVLYADVIEPTYHVVVTEYTLKFRGEKRTDITVSGKGIGAVYDVPYSVYGLNVIVYNKLIVVRNRSIKSPLILYSDTNSELIEFVGDNICKKRTYKTVDGKTTYTIKEMRQDECNQVLNKVAQAEKKATNPVKETLRKALLRVQLMIHPEFDEGSETNKG